MEQERQAVGVNVRPHKKHMGDLGIGARHITVSTVGLVPAIRRFADEGLQVGLAISLHATEDGQRSAMMPVNRRWNIAELLAACRDYQDATNRRVTFEWALIAGENDGEAEARRLGGLLQDLHCHVNLIPLMAGLFYYATPENNWAELIHPHLREWMVVKDPKAVWDLFEGAGARKASHGLSGRPRF